jgi:heme exporter protein D
VVPQRIGLAKTVGGWRLMYFDSISAVWHMDGHGVYVWLAYALTTLPLILMVWFPIRRIRQHWRWLQAEQRRHAALPGDRSSEAESAV